MYLNQGVVGKAYANAVGAGCHQGLEATVSRSAGGGGVGGEGLNESLRYMGFSIPDVLPSYYSLISPTSSILLRL
jgi:hypothetical protein